MRRLIFIMLIGVTGYVSAQNCPGSPGSISGLAANNVAAVEMDQFLKSDLFALVANNPAFSNMQTNTFSVVEAASIITHAPLLKMDVQWQIPAPFSTAATGSARIDLAQ